VSIIKSGAHHCAEKTFHRKSETMDKIIESQKLWISVRTRFWMRIRVRAMVRVRTFVFIDVIVCFMAFLLNVAVCDSTIQLKLKYFPVK